MHKFQFLLLLCLAAICLNINGHEHEMRKGVYCGRRLIDLLSLVCKGEYNRPSKKATHDFTTHDFMFPRQGPEDVAIAAAIECRNLKLLEQFNNENNHERDIQLQQEQQQQQQQQQQAAIQQEQQFPFQTRLEALDFGNFVRERRQISQECCLKPCTLREIKTYCAA